VIPRPIVSVIALVVTMVWTGNFVADILVDGYESNLAIHAAFMVIIGSAFALGRKSDDKTTEEELPSGAHAKREVE
jgi:hypothetical protein